MFWKKKDTRTIDELREENKKLRFEHDVLFSMLKMYEYQYSKVNEALYNCPEFKEEWKRMQMLIIDSMQKLDDKGNVKDLELHG